MKSKEVRSAISISPRLIEHVRFLFRLSLDWAISNPKERLRKINFYTPYALPSYPLAVPALEAWIGEVFLGETTKVMYKNSPLFNELRDIVDRLKIRERLILVPYILFNKCPDKGSQPYQDTSALIEIRNKITHYQMIFDTPNMIKHLEQRGVIITLGNNCGIPIVTPWPDRLSCIRGIIWAYNTVCKMVKFLCELTEGQLRDFAGLSIKNFSIIDESEVQNYLMGKGIDVSELE